VLMSHSLLLLRGLQAPCFLQELLMAQARMAPACCSPSIPPKLVAGEFLVR
jgi:hypothetical protein